MHGMSRSSERGKIIAAFAGGAIVLMIDLFVGYIAYLNHRISDELLHHQWRTPTEIYSVAPGSAHIPIARVYGTDWRVTTPVRLSDLPGYLPNAFLAAEDVRFHHHAGVDPIGILRALVANLRQGGISQGGSTIDQQLIKARFLTQQRTFRRKIVEVLLALILDARMSKQDILEAYLNDVYLGHFGGRPVLGVDEAARLFFDKKPGSLRVDEAALLAGIIRAPNRDTPDKRPDLARSRRDAILAVMLKHRWISQPQYDGAIRRGVELTYGRLPEQPYPFYLSALRNEVARDVGESAMRGGRLRIFCEMDPAMQQAAERAARGGVNALNRRYSWLAATSRHEPLQVALLSADPRTGGVRALVGGADYHHSTLDHTVQTRRQPGSAFKPFAYLAAIASKKYTNSSFLLDEPMTIRLAGDQEWEPHNYDEQFRGRVSVRQAFEKSLNVPTVRMTEDIGVGNVISTVKDLGFNEDFKNIPALPLGVTEVSVWELTRAYTIFPNLGVLTEPHLLTEVRDPQDKVLYKFVSKPARVVSAAAAFVIHSLLRGVVRRGTASRLSRWDLDFVAGKTGTTNDYRDAWFVGYTPGLLTTVWVGYDRGFPLRLSSAEAALPVWAGYMAKVDLSDEEIAPPEGVVLREIDPESGLLWADGCPGPLQEVYLSGTAPTSDCPQGFLGAIVRKILFDKGSFDEPAAITFEKFRRWSAEVDHDRQQIEGVIGRLRRFFGGH
jgi:penicillin-binding protein 1B